jgi:hypothetical protein
MKVGDVVRRGDEFGLVVDPEWCGLVLYFASWHQPWLILEKDEPLALTVEQRAIVNAAIAAEALRRMR